MREEIVVEMYALVVYIRLFSEARLGRVRWLGWIPTIICFFNHSSRKHRMNWALKRLPHSTRVFHVHTFDWEFTFCDIASKSYYVYRFRFLFLLIFRKRCYTRESTFLKDKRLFLNTLKFVTEQPFSELRGAVRVSKRVEPIAVFPHRKHSWYCGNFQIVRNNVSQF